MLITNMVVPLITNMVVPLITNMVVPLITNMIVPLMTNMVVPLIKDLCNMSLVDTLHEFVLGTNWYWGIQVKFLWQNSDLNRQ